MDLRNLIDIVVVAIIFYWLLALLRGTTGWTLLRGLLTLLFIGFMLGNVLRLTMFSWLLRNSFTALLVAVPILFQPELRRTIERIGRTGLGSPSATPATERIFDLLAQACRRLSDRHLGALVVLERETGLQEYIDTGVELDSVVSVELLMAIFSPATPLHDGAVVIRHGRVAAAGCVLPLSDSVGTEWQLGTRHRAALGITQQTDAVAVIVSEETGIISVSNGGRMVRNLDDNKLRRILRTLYRRPIRGTMAGLWRERRIPVLERFRP
ncbi:MAG: TIGR00159 family protein [Chloroflexota bacterium]|nr:MAG: TIGR00159 family protein [Chloroflexota bacterium]